MKKAWIGLVLAGVLVLAVLLGIGKTADGLRQGIAESLREDFRIKESLGQLFLMEREKPAAPASGQAEMTALIRPAQGETEAITVCGDPCWYITCGRFNAVCAVADGVIETVGEGRVTLRHTDGKLSVYQFVTPLCAAGQRVLAGETVGYVEETLCYRLLENCVALDPADYIAP